MDILWVSSIGASFVLVLIVALVFTRFEGRAKIYYSGVFFAFVLLALTSLVTAWGAEVTASAWFKVPRTVAWSIVAVAALRTVLYQLNFLNGSKSADSGS